jgi:hypothetical protein
MFCVRGSPGAMLPQLSFARCISPSGRAYHLMLNIQFRGGSEARHEADVSIVAEGDSPVGRMLAALSSASTLLGVIECKNYTKYVSIGQLRQFIGGIIDMEQGKGRRRLPGVKLRQNCLFVSTKRMSMDAGYYARAFDVALEGELRPPPPTQVFVVSDREREFIGVARNWITRAAV